MTYLSKSRVITHRQCSKRLWLQIYRKDLIPEVDTASKARFDEGNLVGDIARQLYPDGVFIDTLNMESALTQTQAALDKNQVIFEAAFYEQDVLIRADLLLPNPDGYHVIEVKSSTAVKDYHLEDASIQAWVMEQAGYKPASVFIGYINNQFLYQGDSDYKGLFNFEDISKIVDSRLEEVSQWVEDAKRTLSLEQEPRIQPGGQCEKPFTCEFQSYCMPLNEQIEHPIHILPNAKKLIDKLNTEGFKDLRDVPVEYLENPKHIRMHQSIIKNESILDESAIKQIKQLEYPRFYLDFETIAFAVPIWKGTRPYVQLPFQWSCHIESSNGDIQHKEFLDTTGNDPRYEFAKTLVEVLGNEGPIVVYNAGFEGGRVRELATEFPEIGAQLIALIDRFYDLLPLARDNYYHPDMQGSWSIKAVLPTIAPELDYANLEVGDGAQAQDAFRKVISPNTLPNDKVKIRGDMLKYCAQDTWAMLKIVQTWTN